MDPIKDFKNKFPNIILDESTEKSILIAFRKKIDYNKIICLCNLKVVKNDGRRTLYKACSNECKYKFRIKTKRSEEEQNIITEKIMATKLVRYGDPYYVNMDKRRKTNIKNHGDEYYNNYNAIKSTNLEKYGTEFLFTIDEIREKSKKTNFNKYGSNYYGQSIEGKNRISKSNKIAQNIEGIKEKKIRSKKITGCKKLKEIWGIDCVPCNEGGVEVIIPFPGGKSFIIDHTTLFNRLKSLKHNPISIDDYNFINPLTNIRGSFSSSGKEKLLSSYISSIYPGEILLNKRGIIGNKELDIYLPSLGVAFEFNGSYWHSDLVKSKNYHRDKLELGIHNGIRIINIYEPDWDFKNEIIKSQINNILKLTSNKIYARKCTIREVNFQDKNKFLKENHIQGDCISKYNIGLYDKDKLIFIMTFGGLRKNLNQTIKVGSFELLRCCSILNYNIVGGASRLIKYFIRKYQPKEIISYSQRDYSNGNLYQKLGFSLLNTSTPGYFYVKQDQGIRYNRFMFRKDILIKEGYDPNKTEYEIMTERNYFRIWDCGTQKWILNA